MVIGANSHGENEMNKDAIMKMLNTVYTIEIKGSALGYLLTILAVEQERLDKNSRLNITNIDAVMAAVANNVVGNDLLHAAYAAAGPDFLGFAMGMNSDAMKKVMEATDMEVVKAEVEKALKNNRTDRDKNLH